MEGRSASFEMCSWQAEINKGDLVGRLQHWGVKLQNQQYKIKAGFEFNCLQIKLQLWGSLAVALWGEQGPAWWETEMLLCYLYKTVKLICVSVCETVLTVLGALAYGWEKTPQNWCGCPLFPGVLILFLAFFAFLHCWLNAFAEMLRFADRMFYKVRSRSYSS